ncbi:MAG: glycosyltransferase family 4 protein [Lachnospiraceae bacterium]|nr:glycosyltransferase family 4 protein [Lachnospiraceae bacterium]
MEQEKDCKDAVIIANFCGNLDGSDNNRFVYLAKMLEDNCNVELITSDFNHLTKKHRNNTAMDTIGQITLLHEIGYSKNISLRRFLSHWIWGRNVKKYLSLRKKPDLVYCAVPSLTSSLAAAKYCEKNKIKFLIDIQDLWPDAFKMVFHVPIISNLLYFPFRQAASGIYSRANEIIAVSQTYVDMALKSNKMCKRGYSVFLGTELQTFDRNAQRNMVCEKPSEELWLGYCGTLGSSYDLTTVFDALKLVSEKGICPPKFIIMGDGPRKSEFANYAKCNGIYCKFMGLLPYEKMCGIIKSCDMVINPITHGAAQSIINKHADYAASGLPVLNTQENVEYRKLIEQYQMGFNCKNNDSADLAEKMILLISDKALREHMGNNARRCAEERFDRRHSYQKIKEIIWE